MPFSGSSPRFGVSVNSDEGLRPTTDMTEATGVSEEPELFDLDVGEQLRNIDLCLVAGEGIFDAIGGHSWGDNRCGRLGRRTAVEGIIQGGVTTQPPDLVRGLVISMSLTGIAGAVKGGSECELPTHPICYMKEHLHVSVEKDVSV